MKTPEEVDMILNALFLAKLAIVCALLIVGIIHVATAAGPNCPPPVPADWLGFCEAYDLR